MEFYEFQFGKPDPSPFENPFNDEEEDLINSSSQNSRQNMYDQDGNLHYQNYKDAQESEQMEFVDGQAQVEDQDQKQIANIIDQKKIYYTYILQNQMQIHQSILMLGEVMLDLSLFNSRQDKNFYVNSHDYPWNMFRPASKIQNFSDGSLLSYHDTAVMGKLLFTDTLQLLYQLPDQNAHNVALKLEKYQMKIVQIQQIMEKIKEYYSQEDLTTIFTEIQSATLEKAMKMLEVYNQTPSENQIYMYGINTVNPTNLLITPFAIGQSQKLVELLGGNYEAYKLQMLRKGFLNFNSINSHLQMLLISIGVEKSVFLEARTIEGFQLPMNITIENHLLHSIKLNPVDYSFNTILTIYKIQINQNIIDHLNEYRLNHRYEGLPDDLSYMLDCQIFLQKNYQNKYDLSSERRCHYKFINQKTPVDKENPVIDY